jgi:G3E family GTPase
LTRALSPDRSALFPSAASGLFGRRLRSERGARIPVTVVSGFLGSGKTTLIKDFLSRPEGAGTAVVVNEFGEIGIDDALLRSSTEQTVLLGNGCLCCNTRSDLQIALRRLVADRERSVIPHFARIVIETSGLADLGPILTTFTTDRALGGEFHIEAAVTVVDAARRTNTLDEFGEARRQVILADRLVLSKTDLSDSPVIEDVTRLLRKLNPRAEIVIADHGAVDPSCLIAPVQNTRINLCAEDAEHSDGIRSFVLRDAEPIDWDAFARALEMLIALRGADLLRVKGLLNVRRARGPVIVHVVGHLAHPPIELQAWPDHDHSSRVVFITRGVSEGAVKDLFAAARAVAKR